MASSGDYIVILHVEDGEQWAKFFSTRLQGQNYGIRSELRDLSLSSSSSTVNSFPCTQNLGDSGLGCRTIRNSDLYTDDPHCDKSRVIILSPDALTFETFPVDIKLLNPKRSLFLLLGVDIEDVRAYFHKDSDLVFKCRCCVVQSDEKSINDAMVEIIQVYEYNSENSSITEYDENVYDFPPFPRQLNKLETVITRELQEKDRDVYFLLERPADTDTDLSAVLDNYPGENIPVACICDRLYKFTLPGHVKGEVFFRIKSDIYTVGEGSVLALTNLERLRFILNEEVVPLSLIASALGLLSDDRDSIDTALASRLQQLGSAKIIQQLFYEVSLYGSTASEERADIMYPTLLHFAADWNLRKFCSELLRYPGMFDAAVLENKDGHDARSLAFNKGFSDLEDDIIQFVTNNKPSIDDDGTYIHPSAVFNPPQPHKPHSTSGYINVSHSSSSNYVRMDNVRKTSSLSSDTSRSQVSDQEPLSPVSHTSDSVFQNTYRGSDDLNDINLHLFSNNESCQQYSQSTSVRSTAKALKILGVDEKVINASKASMISKDYSRLEMPKTPLENIPHGVRYNGTSQFFGHQDKSFNSDDQFEVHNLDQKHKIKKLTGFLNKIKSKRSTSEGDIHVPGVKKTMNTRSEKIKKKSSEINFQERDSGSYSGDESPKTRSSLNRKNKPKEFTERENALIRQRPLSRRAQLASKEVIKNAPLVPHRERRSDFKSYLSKF